MATGTVKWFNNAKGYGFICPTGGGEDIFAHFSTVMMDGYKSLKAGQGVIFEVSRGPKGLHAIDIRAADENETVEEQSDKESHTASNEHEHTAQVREEAYAD